jgi:ATP-dependent Clp protease ATP-binding subunit ClpA
MFERFTVGARRALAVAQEEAKRLEHDFIGTEHLLLGLLAAGEGLAFDVLTELDVTLDEAREKVSELIHPPRSVAPGSPPFTPLAKKVLERALRESLDLGDSHIGSEHVLLGLTDVPDGGAVQVLRHLGAGNLDVVREEVLARVTKRPHQTIGIKRARLWSTRGAPTTSAPAQTGPRCAKCNAALVDEARYRVIEVLPGEESEAGPESDPAAGGAEPPPPMPVTVMYCRQCGTALGTA